MQIFTTQNIHDRLFLTLSEIAEPELFQSPQHLWGNF